MHTILEITVGGSSVGWSVVRLFDRVTRNVSNTSKLCREKQGQIHGIRCSETPLKEGKSKGVTNGRMDGRTDGRTDRPSFSST